MVLIFGASGMILLFLGLLKLRWVFRGKGQVYEVGHVSAEWGGGFFGYCGNLWV